VKHIHITIILSKPIHRKLLCTTRLKTR